MLARLVAACLVAALGPGAAGQQGVVCRRQDDRREAARHGEGARPDHAEAGGLAVYVVTKVNVVVRKL